MPTSHTTTAKKKKSITLKPPSKRAREPQSDNGPAILPGMEHFVDLVRKVNPDVINLGVGQDIFRRG